MTLTGTPTRIFDTGVHGCGEPGSYGFLAGNEPRCEPSTVRCPYCAEPLDAVHDSDNYRVMKTLARRTGEVDCLTEVVPPTHLMLRCFACRQSFTVLRGED